MTKRLFFLFCVCLFILSCRALPEGSIVEIPCKAVDMQDNPLQGVMISVVNSDSFIPVNLKIEMQKATDKNGEVIVGYEHLRSINRFIRGEPKGKLVPIELWNGEFQAGSPSKTMFHYDSLVPMTIRLISNAPRMKSGQMEIFVRSDASNSRLILNQSFSISSTRLDTLFKVNMFSQPEFDISCSLKLQDTSRFQTIRVLKAAKRDSVFTIEF
jgi:hypothetical protein